MQRNMPPHKRAQGQPRVDLAIQRYSTSGRVESDQLMRYESREPSFPPPPPAKFLPNDFHYRVISSYKTQQCKQNQAHDRKNCMNWHSTADRRRNPFEFGYSSNECLNHSDSSPCSQGDSCKNSHNLLERMYHPETYKISLCQHALAGVNCEKGSYCAFAHSQADLRQSQPAPFIIKEAISSATSPLDRLVLMIKYAGEDGILGSDLPKRYFATYGEQVELCQEGMRMKIKDILSKHDSIRIELHKAAQPRYIFDPEAGEKRKQAEESALGEQPREPLPLSVLRERLIEIIRDAGLDGILGSDIPKRYGELYNEKFEINDGEGGKVRLKELVVSHPDITIEMYKKLQPKYFYIKDSNMNYKSKTELENKSQSDAESASSSIKATIHSSSSISTPYAINEVSSADPGLLAESLVKSQLQCQHLKDQVQSLLAQINSQSPPLPANRQEKEALAIKTREVQALEVAYRKIQEDRLQEYNQLYSQLSKIESVLSWKDTGNLNSNELFQSQRDSLSGIVNMKMYIKEKFDQAKASAHPGGTSDSTAGYTGASARKAALCAFSTCNLPGVFVCTGCHEVLYCGSIHQKQHWDQQHNKECKHKV